MGYIVGVHLFFWILSAGVAQRVEQLICNQQVAGSSPIASSSEVSLLHGGVPEWPKGADCKSAGGAYGGSNPPPSIILLISGYPILASGIGH